MGYEKTQNTHFDNKKIEAMLNQAKNNSNQNDSLLESKSNLSNGYFAKRVVLEGNSITRINKASYQYIIEPDDLDDDELPLHDVEEKESEEEDNDRDF